MKKLTRFLLPVLLLSAAAGAAYGQKAPDEGVKVVTFRFVPGDDMFYIPWGGNDAELNRLNSLIDEYRSEITCGCMPVYVDGYCASMPTHKENLHTAFIRANRVKSELITHKGLIEDNFITKNYTTSYTFPDGTVRKDIVVVTLRIPAKAEEPEPKPESCPEHKPEPKPESCPEHKPEPKPEPVVEVIPEPAAPVKPSKPYCFAVRTNLLYDAFLLPTLGVEWRVSRTVGIKLDGSYSYWGNEHGRVQKIWLVNPELRFYMGKAKRFYLGAGGNMGEYNVYKFLIGSMFPKDTGYQGKLWNAGLTLGYQLLLSRSLSLDFNLGVGYTSLEYDSFRVVDKVRVFKDRNKSKKFWGPTQAGVNLVWTIGGNKR